MSQSRREEQRARFAVENVGGIDETAVDVPPGVTVLAGENATNRTSFLQAVQAGLGSQNASLKGDADRGRVELQIGGDTYERELVREHGHVTFQGEGYLDDPTLADLFAFLLDDNEARRAVERGSDLREIIMRPVDVEAIRAEIEELEAEKDSIDDQFAEIGNRKADLTDLEQRRTSLRGEIEEKREELAAKEAEIEASSAHVEEIREEKASMEERLEELSDTRNDLERVRQDVERVEESITSLQQEQRDIEEELEELPETPMGEHADLDAELDRLRREKSALEREVQELQSAIQFNEEMLEEGAEGALADLAEGSGDEPTAQLLEDEELVCWTCGSEVSADQIEATLDSLREGRRSKLEDVGDIDDRLADLQTQQRNARRTQQRRDELEARRRTVEDELEDRRDALETLKDQRSELIDEVEALEEAVDDLETEDFGDVLDLHREANQLEFELDRLEADIDDVTEEIEAIEAEIDREDDLEARREELLDDLEDCRTRIDRIEREAIEEFNTHMDAILDVLGYDNLERIWIERIERTVRDGRGTTTQAVFELHVVRRTESGAVYEDTVDHLSESEREVTGLIFALAGYLVHDVHEMVPFMLLDSLEAIDSNRIAALVDYLADCATYLVVALLPEDARALSEDYERVDAI